MTSRIKRWVACGCVVWAILGATASEGHAAGRWIMHMLTNTPEAGTVGKPIDVIPVPETNQHWVWVVWFDPALGTYTYDYDNPYVFSNGSVQWEVPEYNQWYYLMLYDTVTGMWF